MASYNRKGITLLAPGAILGLWLLVTGLQLVDEIILPSPIAVAKVIPIIFTQDHFGSDVLRTVIRVMIAIIIASTIGIPLGLYLGYRKNIYDLIESPIHALRSIPASALFPLFLIVIGVGEQAIVALAMYPSMLVILVNTVNGAALCNKRRLHQAKALDLSTFTLLREVVFFEALPNILDGLRTAVSYALVLVIAVEMFIGVGDTGLGRKIYLYQSAYRIPETYASIMIAGAIGVMLNWILTLLERKALAWVPNTNNVD